MDPELDDDLEAPDPLLEALAATPVGEVLPRRTVIDGQYRVERVLGEGGMGVVYLARDLRLDRDVAIKVGSEQSASSVMRLAREAVALARLSHPNVVVIYQVGELDGRPYVAMEYVPGGTARSWCEGKRWRDIVGLYQQAGQGLAAAHDAGLVHRDFKPDNVLVGLEGRPRVADFGLAQALHASVEAAGSATGAGRTTRAIGTPAYMAPEQFAGGEIDARADQFAFCVSVWEALFGERPFSPSERETDRDGEPARPVRRTNSEVPRHVEAALRRGMASAPDARWPALESLLAELRRDPTRRRTVWIGGAALGAAGIAIATVATLRSRRPPDPCAAGDEAIAQVWSPARADAVHAGIAPAGSPPWIAKTAERVRESLDGWAQRWSGEYRAVCQASRTWTPGLSIRGFACLDDRKRQLAATIDVLATSPALADKADRMIDALADPGRCADAAFLAAAVPPPDDPATAGQVDLAFSDLAHVEALAFAGQLKEAASQVAAIVPRAQRLGYAPLVARALVARGKNDQNAGDYSAAFNDLHEAYYAARRGKDASAAAVAAAEMATALLELSRDGEAIEWARLAEVDAAGTADPRAETQVAAAWARVLRARGDAKGALVHADRYVVLAQQLRIGVHDALKMRADIRDALGDSRGALQDLDEALRGLRARYGDHPEASGLLSVRALVLLHARDADGALAAAREGLAIAERLVGPDSIDALDALATLAAALKDTGHLEESLRAFDRSLALTRQHDGPRSYNAASDMNNRADLLRTLGRTDEAIAQWTESAAIFTEVSGPEALDIAIVELNIWNALYSDRRTLAGAPHVARAVAILAKTPDSPMYAQALLAIGITELEQKDVAAAERSLEQGLAKIDDDVGWRTRGRLALARVKTARGDRAAARKLLEDARIEAKASGNTGALSEIEDLLSHLPK